MLLAYYGDDFTGSTDVMESLTYGGVETVLFVQPPSGDQLAKYSHVRAIGIAGSSRAMTPHQMETTLPDALEALRSHHPKIVHYKVCSTFDSSPRTGSIGRAIDVGQRVFQNRFVPLVVGAPVLQRFCVFGNLFARSGLDSPPFRLDRHPTMRQHPVTPMSEADLRVHLASQTERSVELLDVLALADFDSVATRLSSLGSTEAPIVLFDTLTDQHLATIGRLIWEAQQREGKTLFVCGSSGIEYSLTGHWLSLGLTGAKPQSRPVASADPVDTIAVVSGSCSPVTDRQIGWAVDHGFTEIAIDTVRMLGPTTSEAEVLEIARRMRAEVQAGRSVIAHTSRGPDDQRMKLTRESYGNDGVVAARLGSTLGAILHQVLRTCSLGRVAVTGGDTSGHVARALGIEALEMVGPLAPGSPLCLARSGDPHVDGTQITFKGGQVGHDDFFAAVLRGRPEQHD